MSGRSPLTRAVLFIEELRKLDPEFPAQTALAFLIIAGEEGISQAETATRMGLSKSAIQRIFDRLSEKGSLSGRPGLGLIEVRLGAADARQRCAYLTAKGRRVLASLTHYMEA